MGRKLALVALAGFQDDINDLPDLATRKMAIDMLVHVRSGRVRGVALEERAVTGDLGDCFKLYFDPDGSRKPRFRLVYRFTPNEVQAVAVEAVAVGRRQGLEAYLRAAVRLGRVDG
ncbi:hypothetical protein N1031_03345 [Herbiconiux moechotypicola]|uniref:Addiction module toxin RelE n=1 Tax=Herbiconiux moechotypicola TaxID=637393 RepID=A0ABN3DC24_9MICO|nr:hypothetical protein [Herbiconiux moechotypicola]MCS5728784.1 hypothetical protein [Herbiconiux moechotypicola]